MYVERTTTRMLIQANWPITMAVGVALLEMEVERRGMKPMRFY
jgi:hypothetical protein